MEKVEVLGGVGNTVFHFEIAPQLSIVDAMSCSLTPPTADGPTVEQMLLASDSRAGSAASTGYRRARYTP
jgi:hypothetical protein